MGISHTYSSSQNATLTRRWLQFLLFASKLLSAFYVALHAACEGCVTLFNCSPGFIDLVFSGPDACEDTYRMFYKNPPFNNSKPVSSLVNSWFPNRGQYEANSYVTVLRSLLTISVYMPN